MRLRWSWPGTGEAEIQWSPLPTFEPPTRKSNPCHDTDRHAPVPGGRLRPRSYRKPNEPLVHYDYPLDGHERLRRGQGVPERVERVKGLAVRGLPRGCLLHWPRRDVERGPGHARLVAPTPVPGTEQLFAVPLFGRLPGRADRA